MKRSFGDRDRYRLIELIGLGQVKRERSYISKKKREKKKILHLHPHLPLLWGSRHRRASLLQACHEDKLKKADAMKTN